MYRLIIDLESGFVNQFGTMIVDENDQVNKYAIYSRSNLNADFLSDIINCENISKVSIGGGLPIERNKICEELNNNLILDHQKKVEIEVI